MQSDGLTESVGFVVVCEDAPLHIDADVAAAAVVVEAHGPHHGRHRAADHYLRADTPSLHAQCTQTPKLNSPHCLQINSNGELHLISYVISNIRQTDTPVIHPDYAIILCILCKAHKRIITHFPDKKK